MYDIAGVRRKGPVLHLSLTLLHTSLSQRHSMGVKISKDGRGGGIMTVGGSVADLS